MKILKINKVRYFNYPKTIVIVEDKNKIEHWYFVSDYWIAPKGKSVGCWNIKYKKHETKRSN